MSIEYIAGVTFAGAGIALIGYLIKKRRDEQINGENFEFNSIGNSSKSTGVPLFENMGDDEDMGGIYPEGHVGGNSTYKEHRIIIPKKDLVGQIQREIARNGCIEVSVEKP